MLGTILSLGTVCALAMEVELGYTGPINSQTGEPSISTQQDAYEERVLVSEGVYFDRLQQRYLYGTPTGEQVLCSVADGMIVQEPVKITPDTGADITLYRDGQMVEQFDWTEIYEVGDYMVEALIKGQEFPIIAFSIIGDTAGNVTGYTMPSGFTVTNVTLNDQEIGYDRGYVSFAQEGHYVVNYRCVRNGLTYQLDVLIDHTPPVLALAELDENNRVRGPVSLADLEENCSISITLDGKEISYRSTLTQAGDYQVTVMDQAGNINRYEFSILLYLDWNGLAFLGIILLVLISVSVYIFVSRKRLEVR